MLNVVSQGAITCRTHRSTLRDWLALFERARGTASSSRCKPDHALNSSKRVNVLKSFDAFDCADAFLNPSGYLVFSVFLIIMLIREQVSLA
jgi:hypothetical protein